MENIDPQSPQAPEQNLIRPKKRFRLISVIGKFIFIFFVIGFIVFAFLAYKVMSSPDNSDAFFSQIKHLITSGDKPMAGETDDRINILLLGVGGAGHDGPYLTDTIMLISFKPSTKKVAMLSIPRDLLVPIKNFGQRKINNAYALAEAFKSGSGGATTSEVISEVFGVPVHYYVMVDFDGFKKIVDDLGGVTIDVENTLEDEYYPVPGKETATTSERFEHLIIEKGKRLMNGDLALKYVRSRKAKGVEGSDFARSRRQQKLLVAIKDKTLSFSTLANPKKITAILQTLNDHLDTNMEAWEILRLYSLTKNIKMFDITNHVLDDGPMSPLEAIQTEDLYALVPKSEDFSDLKYLAGTIFEAQPVQPIEIKKTEIEERSPTLAVPRKVSKIEVQNGTKITGLAGKVSEFLEGKNYNVIKFGNSPVQTYKKTLIYDITRDRNEETIKELEQIFAAIVFNSGAPDAVPDSLGNTTTYPIVPETDILIILGQDLQGKY